MPKIINTIDKYSKYFFAAILIIVPLFPKFPFIRIPTTYVSIRIEDFLLLILGFLTFLYLIKDIKSILKDKIVVSLLLFFAIGLVSIISGVYLTKTISLQIGLLHLFRRIEYAIPFIAALVFFKNKKMKGKNEFYIKILMLVTLVAFLYGFGQRFFNFPVIITQNEEYSKGVALRWTPGAHINSTFAGHYDMASFLVLVFPIFTILFISFPNIRSKLVLLLPMGAILWLLQASVSRISLVSWGLATSLAFFILKKYKEIVIFGIIAFLLVILSPSLMGRYQRFVDVYKKKLFGFNIITVVNAVSPIPTVVSTPTPVPVFEDRSTNIRLAVEWPRSIRAFKKNPLLGTGYSSITLATDNDYLRLLGEVGILGFLGYILVFYRILVEYWKGIVNIDKFNIFNKALILGSFCALIGIFVTAIFIDIFEASKFAIILWTLLGLSIITIRNKLNEQEN